MAALIKVLREGLWSVQFLNEKQKQDMEVPEEAF